MRLGSLPSVRGRQGLWSLDREPAVWFPDGRVPLGAVGAGVLSGVTAEPPSSWQAVLAVSPALSQRSAHSLCPKPDSKYFPLFSPYTWSVPQPLTSVDEA